MDDYAFRIYSKRIQENGRELEGMAKEAVRRARSEGSLPEAVASVVKEANIHGEKVNRVCEMANVEMFRQMYSTEDDKKQQGFEQVMEGLRERVSFHVNNGDLGEARRHILAALECVQKMPEGFWKDKFLREIRRDHKRVIESAPKARLNKILREEMG